MTVTTITVRKSRNVPHLSDQAGTYYGAPLFESTLCGRTVNERDGWVDVSGQTDGTVCAKCESIYSARLDAEIEEGRSRDVAMDRDGSRIRNVTHDDTGDVIAEWDGCIVGVRFSTVAEAADFLAGDRSMSSRPAYCPLPSGGYGACVRHPGHDGKCAAANGDRFDFSSPEPDEMAEIRELLTGNPWVPVSSPVAEYRARQAAMRRHPAGKGRPTITGAAYRAGMPAVPEADGVLYY